MRSIAKYGLALICLFFCDKSVTAQGIFQLWGTTRTGGSSGVGNIYSMDSSGNSFRNRFSIPAINSGRAPGIGKLYKMNGLYYGMTEGGPSVLFEWNPVTNIYTKKIDLEESYNTWGNGNLAEWNGKLYGIVAGKERNDHGGIFEWDPITNIFRIRRSFTTAEGGNAEGGLVLFGNKFYSSATGKILEWDPMTNALTIKAQVPAHSYGDMILVGDKFYGTANGRIFEWRPSTNQLIIKTTMSPGGGLHENITFANGKIYGTSAFVIFELDTLTNVLTQRKSFPTGQQCYSGLTMLNGKFYGVCYNGGGNNQGVIFEWDPITNVLVNKIDMNESTGTFSSTSLTLDVASGKMVGMASGNHSAMLPSTIFEYDPVANVAVKKIEMDTDHSNGSYIGGDLAYLNGAFYGATDPSYIQVIFEWKPGTQVFSKKNNLYDLDLSTSAGLTVKDNKLYGQSLEWDPVNDILTANNSGIYPMLSSLNNKSLVLYNGKFYGINESSLFEWDPSNSTVTNKVNLDIQRGDPEGVNIFLSLCNGKFYVVFSDWEDHPAGLIYEWDPVTNIYALKYSMLQATGSRPLGNLVEHDGLLYGITAEGGANNAGVIFSFDPITSTYTKRFDMADATGSLAKGALTFSGSKFYGTTRDGGLYNKGVVFEFDPVTNAYTVKRHFNGTDGSSPSNNNLIRVPASVSSGLPGSCTSPLSVVIDNTNYNTWVPLVDFNGDIIAEINAHGNTLGLVNYQVYVHDGSPREDASGKLYLDRNLTITPATQPATPVEVRLYITETEFQTLRTATNSQGQPSGINTISDLGFFKNGNSCSGIIQNTATLIPATATTYEGGYVLTASISSFSSFYFTTKTVIALPLTLLSFEAKKQGTDVILNWKTSQEIQTKDFIVEKSTDGQTFSALATLPATGRDGQYAFTDAHALTQASGRVLYRLKMRDLDGRFTYSNVAIIVIDQTESNLTIYPNPVYDQASMLLQLESSDILLLRITDNSGKTLHQQSIPVEAGGSSITLPVRKLAAGTYWITVQGKNFDKRATLIKK